MIYLMTSTQKFRGTDTKFKHTYSSFSIFHYIRTREYIVLREIFQICISYFQCMCNYIYIDIIVVLIIKILIDTKMYYARYIIFYY